MAKPLNIKIQMHVKSEAVEMFGLLMGSGNLTIKYGKHIHANGMQQIILFFSMCSIKGGLAENLQEFILNICTEGPAPAKKPFFWSQNNRFEL